MNIPWEDKKCILCLLEKELCEEHILLDSLGGKLTCNFLCRDCNSLLGHSAEARAKSDPSILLSMRHLAEKIPELSKKITESHPHLGYSKEGVSSGYFRNGEFKVKSKKLKDESLIQPTEDARKTISKILKKSSLSCSEFDAAIEKFDDIAENTKIEISPGLEVVKWTVDKLEFDLSKAELMSPLVPLKIAYEFLALHLGSSIYHESLQLQEIRDCLINQTMNDSAVRVERLTSNKYLPFHGIVFKGNDPYSIVDIRLFGWLAFTVHFLKLSVGGPRFVYTHELDTNNEVVDIVGKSE